jgi:Uncharacterised BCR, YnfA/UPF0060 family
MKVHHPNTRPPSAVSAAVQARRAGQETAKTGFRSLRAMRWVRVRRSSLEARAISPGIHGTPDGYSSADQRANVMRQSGMPPSTLSRSAGLCCLDRCLPLSERGRRSLPEPHFGRILAAYGGVFIVGSLLWVSSRMASGLTGGCCGRGDLSPRGRGHLARPAAKLIDGKGPAWAVLPPDSRRFSGGAGVRAASCGVPSDLRHVVGAR